MKQWKEEDNHTLPISQFPKTWHHSMSNKFNKPKTDAPSNDQVRDGASDRKKEKNARSVCLCDHLCRLDYHTTGGEASFTLLPTTPGSARNRGLFKCHHVVS